MPHPKMRYPLMSDITFILLLIIIRKIQTKAIATSFNIVEEGQEITGKLGVEMLTGSLQECSLKCLADYTCQGYEHQQMTHGKGKCFLIHKGCGRNFQRNDKNTTNGKVVMMVNEREKMWIEPCGWTGSQPAFYQSFDSSDGIIFYEGPNQADSVTLVPGPNNYALSLDHIRSQWVDLGVHTEACMTRPETCGAAGGAVSLWLNIIQSGNNGIVSSRSVGSSGFAFFPFFGNILFQIITQNQTIVTSVPPPEPLIWTHIVINYLVPNETQIYYNASELDTETLMDPSTYTPGDGTIFVGRKYIDRSYHYEISIKVDELIFFNQALNSTDIQVLYNATNI